MAGCLSAAGGAAEWLLAVLSPANLKPGSGCPGPCRPSKRQRGWSDQQRNKRIGNRLRSPGTGMVRLYTILCALEKWVIYYACFRAKRLASYWLPPIRDRIGLVSLGIIAAAQPHDTNSRSHTMKILMVLTSHDELGNTGRKTGFWLEEFAAPYYTFLDAGATVTLASPKGGQPPIDPVSDTPEGQTDWTRRFKQDPAAQAAQRTPRASPTSQPGTTTQSSIPAATARCGIDRGPAFDRPHRGLLRCR